jgi:hypothetical protein
MQSAPWIILLKKLPAEFHNQLMLTTTAGTEIAIQIILVYEGDCLVFKGRMAGCQDSGRLFYVPYDRIDYVGLNRVISEDEFREWYGAAPGPEEVNSSAEGKPVNGDGSGQRPVLPNRAALLERIRSRPSTPGS